MSNPLTNLIPASARKWVYAIFSVASAVYGIWEATGGNWTAFAAGLVGAATGALAHGNVALPAEVVSFAKAAEPVIDEVAKAAPVVAADVQAVDAAAAQPVRVSPAKKAPAVKKAAPPAKGQ